MFIWGLGINSAWLPNWQTWASFLICINARWPRIDIEVFLILELLVLTSSVIPCLRVVWFVLSSFNVSVWCQVQRPAVAERDPAPPQLSDAINCQCKAVGKKCSIEACGCHREHLSCTNTATAVDKMAAAIPIRR